MRSALGSCLMLTLLAQALAAPTDANLNNVSPFTYSASGTCLASPEGFDSKLEPVNSGTAWTTSFTSSASVDKNGEATEAGQAVDTASFGVGPRMHTPAAHAYKATFNTSISEPAEDGTVTFHAGTANGTFIAGPHAGQSFTVSGFELRKSARYDGVEVYGGAGSPIAQTLSLAGGKKIQRVCALTILISPPLSMRPQL
jgi:hypothetical protein